MIYYLILLIMVIIVLFLEKKDNFCSFSNPQFFGFKDSEWCVSNKIKTSDSVGEAFRKIFVFQESIEEYKIWRQLFIIAVISSLVALIVFQRPWSDDWFVFVLTLIVFLVSYLLYNFYKFHIYDDRYCVLKENLIELKRKIKIEIN